ncbi:MAG: acetylxylan esterase [Planctomycetes bacterium]|nr:acetylxylan esterase [Planctomycetota bacterium]
MPDIDDFLREQGRKLREKDEAPKTRAEWDKRRADLRDKMFTAMGDFPAKPCDLEPRQMGVLKRDGYTIEKLIFQSRPNVWVTATAYVPDVKAKVPAVLVVHGHWAFARRDPVVQARCLGLVKLGFFVLAVDAFGSGERFTAPARGTYHGALYGSTLWPTGHTLLGMCVYDNRRAVDYILSRPEVNGKLGITGASGGGNQSMYAGALDERIQAVVPVCSVGNFQVYLKAACCVCEVLPGALTFTEEGDVLGLVAPRALMVLSASMDAIQFSPTEAKKSVERAQAIFKLRDAESKLKHQIFESKHDYNQPMREAMYGWMTLQLKGEGKGEAIPEPKHDIEKPEDLACFPDPNDRPKGFLTPPLFAEMVGKELIAKADKLEPDHAEMWEATAMVMRAELKKMVGPIPKLPKQLLMGVGNTMGRMRNLQWEVRPEDGIFLNGGIGSQIDCKRLLKCVVLHHEGIKYELGNSLGGKLQRAEAEFYLLPLRGTTAADKPARDASGGAVDHNSAEHSVWIGRPLLTQWVVDIHAIFTVNLGDKHPRKIAVAAGVAAVPALIAAACFPNLIDYVILIDPPVTYLTDTPYAAGTPMGILAPGILKVGDIPHLAGLIAPRRLIIAGGTTMNGKKLNEKELQAAFAFTSKVYQANKAAAKLTITEKADWEKIEL